eukprot:29819_1
MIARVKIREIRKKIIHVDLCICQCSLGGTAHLLSIRRHAFITQGQLTFRMREFSGCGRMDPINYQIFSLR